MSVTNKEDETKTFFWKLESEKVADESEKGQPFHLLDHKFKLAKHRAETESAENISTVYSYKTNCPKYLKKKTSLSVV